MMTIRHPRIREKGMAVVGALVVVAAASVATATILERQSLLAETLIGERDRAQARWLLRGGLDWARIILFNDARSNAVTLKNAVWAQPISGMEIRSPHDDRVARFSGLIEDEQAKYNLRRLAINGVVQAGEQAALEKLLASLGASARLAPAIAARVADSQYGPQHMPTAPGLRTVHDLIGTEDLTLEALALLAEYLTVLPERTGINVNTASAEVISASIPRLSLSRARRLAEERDRGQWFNSRGDFLNRLDDPELVSDIPLDVRSQWFKVTGEVALEHAQARMRALLHRPGNAPPLVRWMED